MSITRRLLLSVLAGGCAAVIRAAAGSAAVPEIMPVRPADAGFGIRFPRGSILGIDIGATAGGGSRTLISTGFEWIAAASPEGEAIARESAVNLRSDGTLRHRQHHWPR